MAIDAVAEEQAGASQSMTVTATPTAFTAANYTGAGNVKAKRAMFVVETNSIRYTLDGTTPSNTVGHLAVDGDVVIIDGPGNIAGFRAARVTADSSTYVTFFR